MEIWPFLYPAGYDSYSKMFGWKQGWEYEKYTKLMKVVGTIRCVLHAYCCSLKCCLKSSRDVTFNDPYCHCLYTFVLYPYLPLQFYSIVFYYYFQFVTCNMTQACSNVKLVILEGKREWKCPYIVSLAVNCLAFSLVKLLLHRDF